MDCRIASEDHSNSSNINGFWWVGDWGGEQPSLPLPAVGEALGDEVENMPLVDGDMDGDQAGLKNIFDIC